MSNAIRLVFVFGASALCCGSAFAADASARVERRADFLQATRTVTPKGHVVTTSNLFSGHGRYQNSNIFTITPKGGVSITTDASGNTFKMYSYKKADGRQMTRLISAPRGQKSSVLK